MAKNYKLKTSFTQVILQMVVVWLFFLVPFMTFAAVSKDVRGSFFALRYLLPIYLVWFGFFIFNYYWLVPYVFLRKKYKQYAILATVAYFVLCAGSGQLAYFIHQDGGIFGRNNIPYELYGALHFLNLLMNILLTVAAISLRSMQLNKILQKEAQELEKDRINGELERLKGQLNPHFLFNTLNNISSLSAFDPDATQTAIARLSDMLRYVLYETADAKVPIHKDLEFMQNYMDLMNIRYEDTLHLDVQMQPSDPDLQVPPMLFISLLENAYKYGASSLHACSLSVKLEEKEEWLYFTVRNTLLTEQEMANKKKGGVGLVNLEKRLELLYPEEHKLVYGPTKEGQYEAKLALKTR